MTMLKLAPSGGNNGANPQVAKMHGGYGCRGCRDGEEGAAAADFGMDEEGRRHRHRRHWTKEKKDKSRTLLTPLFHPSSSPHLHLTATSSSCPRASTALSLSPRVKDKTEGGGVDETPTRATISRDRREQGQVLHTHLLKV